jgi:hypothetical protein
MLNGVDKSEFKVLMLAVVDYLCKYRSVGEFRLVDDLLRTDNSVPTTKKLAPIWIKLGVYIDGPLGPIPPDATDETQRPLWLRAYSILMEIVKILQGHGLVERRDGIVNWTAGPCDY